MNKYECTECGQEIQSPVPPKRPCRCGARGKWKKVEPSKSRSAIRKNKIIFRVNNWELEQIETLAKLFTGKDISKWVRYAALNCQTTGGQIVE